MSARIEASPRLRHVHCPAQPPSSGSFDATGELRHRLANVLRVRASERLILRTAAGPNAIAEVRSVSREAIQLEIVGPAPPISAPPLHVTVAQVLGKGDRFEQVLQHGVELGVSAFVPLITTRTVKRPTGRDVVTKLRRWQQILDAAAEQARREGYPDAVRALLPAGGSGPHGAAQHSGRAAA